jgi:hypothetical protein
MARIFISYRRRDSAYVTASVSEKLQMHFGGDSVFYDIDNIPLGVDFREHIGNAVGQCDVLLVIIGEEWITAADRTGSRQLDNPGDYVRIEIESALKRNIPIIPVLTGEAQMPLASDLPESLQAIVYRNAAEIRAGSDFRHHIERLIRGLENLFNANQKTKPDERPKESTQKTDEMPEELVRKPQETKKEHERKPRPATPREIKIIEPQKETADKVLTAELVINRIIGNFKGEYLYLKGSIPEKKLINAIQTYAAGVSREAALLLYDNTVFGSAKDGLIMTADSIYWRGNNFDSCGVLHFSDIKTVHYSDGILSSDIYMDGRTIPITMGAQAKLIRIFSDIILNLAPSIRATMLYENRGKTVTELIVTSDDASCQVLIPNSWSKQSEHVNSDATLEVVNSDGDLYAVVICESKSGFPASTTLDGYVDIIRENLRNKLEAPKFFSPVPTTIGGFTARQFEIGAITDGTKTKYLYGILETAGKFYQIMFVTVLDNYKENKSIMLDVISSFKVIA